jgi:hypothetical protein
MQILKSRSVKREAERARNVETIKEKLDGFGEAHANPVRAQIADLRSLRDAGSLTHADYAVTVAALLGAVDAAAGYPAGATLDQRFRAP